MRAGTDLLVISPHLDDAVFSAGGRLAAHPGAVVVTVFAGRPLAAAGLTPWDADCGFAPGEDVIGRRRREDRRALARLAARPHWLDFADSQYGASPLPAAVAAALAEVVRRERARRVLFPLGLFHSDHRLVSDAVMTLVPLHPGIEWEAYEDVPYRTLPGLVDEAVGRLRRRGLAPQRQVGSPPPPVKHRAVACYRSQLRGLGTTGRLGHGDAFRPEGYWRLGA
ncbi:MAG TPA: PIG-L family deacetylase [Candidatus Binatia bacterium]|nr:PIG-L family deacetylase [Candidatus Binatia bacterium]